jgi:hypothetical protein
MTALFEKLKAKLATLSEEKQKRWIMRFLEELAQSERVSNEPQPFVREWIGGREPTREEISEAVEK